MGADLITQIPLYFPHWSLLHLIKGAVLQPLSRVYRNDEENVGCTLTMYIFSSGITSMRLPAYPHLSHALPVPGNHPVKGGIRYSARCKGGRNLTSIVIELSGYCSN